MNDLLVERVSAFVKSPLNNPLTRGEQMELARWFLRIHEQMEVFKQLPDLPITDGQIQCATSVRSTMTTTQTCFSSNPEIIKLRREREKSTQSRPAICGTRQKTLMT